MEDLVTEKGEEGVRNKQDEKPQAGAEDGDLSI
jgi:hypothetical protein